MQRSLVRLSAELDRKVHPLTTLHELRAEVGRTCCANASVAIGEEATYTRRVNIRLGVRLLSALVLVAAGLVVAGTPAQAAGTSPPPPGLTQSGRALWNLEALLRDTFGSGFVCVVYESHRPDFVSKRCGSLSLAQMQLYEFTFAGARQSAFHLVARRSPPFSGNYPIPIEVAGSYVACDRYAKTFLFTNGAAYGLAPECLPSRRFP